MTGLRSLTVVTAGLLLFACGGSDAEQADAPDAAVPAPAATISLADVAGTWNITNVQETGDTATSVLVATSEMTGWTRTFPGRDPVPVRVLAVEGDSIVTETGPYESVIRPGVQVTSSTVLRLQGGQLIGTGVAHYVTTAADSVVRSRSVGTRVN